MKRASIMTGLLALGLAANATADIVGVTAGVKAWNADYSGDVRSGSNRVDVEGDLGLSDEWHPQAYAAIEHPVPLLPNVKLQYTELSQEAKGDVTQSFDGVNFSGAVDTDLDLTHSDIILYYEVLDNVVSIDLGVNFKIFDGELVISERGSARTSQTDIDDVLPLLYVAPSVSLPFTGWTLGGELAGVSYSDNRLIDASAYVRYEIAVLGFEAGWRQMNAKLDDIDELDADVKVAGPYVGLVLDF